MVISVPWNDERKLEATGVVLLCEPGPLVGRSDVVGRGAFAFAAR